MSKLILLQLLMTTLFFSNASHANEEKLFNDLLELGREDNAQKINYRKRFKYTKNNFKVRTFRSVILKNSLVENLEGTKFYRVPKNTIIRTQEIRPGSKYYYLVPKSGEMKDVKYVTQGQNLNHLENILTFHEKTFKPFNREKFKAVEFDKKQIHTYLHAQAGVGSSSPNFFTDGLSLNATNFTLEAGVETFKDLPVFVNFEYLSQNSGQEVQFNTYSIGLRIEYRYRINNDSFMTAGLGANRSLYSSAEVFGQSVDHSLDSFGANFSYNYKSYFLSFDLKKQTYTFDANVFFPNTSLTDDNSATMLSLSIGKEFEVSI
ncbi:hypothetical protein DAY19_10350 [Halobacteriovorax vibrionivorans]|uniref:Outer membrane protein beta-barrel domain-containing protein n=1 Tax=Halobacteriovorax vibrionivorans TaxID=2152716 RepID=A0ABY0IGL1_9BACT|nr:MULTISPECIES: hypothetical protein [Halobacteriovorax]RZF22073.1 hypothetical protein DAY19_10350 [Halobacteriovorax vibrionivorans]TGD46966.1 hypothetical protein EP118_10055 [Halobacteriovorax sp. Y22]